MLVHGIAHLVGFVVPWRLMVSPEGGYKTTLLAGRIDAGDTRIRAVGILWLIAAMAFATSGVGLITLQPWWPTLSLIAARFSLLPSVFGWPDSRVGVWLNLTILGFLFLMPGFAGQ